MSKYRELTREELETIKKSNEFSSLLFQGLGKIFQPLGTVLIWMVISFIILLVIGFSAGIFLSDYLFFKYFDPIVASYWILLIIVYIGGLLFALILVLKSFSDFFLKKLTNAMIRNQKYKHSIDSFEEIVKNTQYIHSIMVILFFIRKIFTFFGEKIVIKEIDKFLRIYTDDLFDFLSGLRSDLQIRLTKQQTLLQSAKSDVSKNIKGTSELAQVSEVQKVRLDRQIKQFEELQRVLVKV